MFAFSGGEKEKGVVLFFFFSFSQLGEKYIE